MAQKSTTSKLDKSKKLHPKRQTIQTILAFATAYHVEQLVDGNFLQMFLN